MTLSIIALFRVLAASQVALTVIGFLVAPNPPRVKFVLVCLGLGLLSYFVEPLVLSAPVHAVLAVFANAIPIFLWAMCRIFFNDDTVLPRPALIVAVATLALIIVGAFRQTASMVPIDAEFWLFRMVPQIIKLGFVVLAIQVAWVGREADLIEPRRRARRWFALGLGGVVAVVIATEIATTFRVPGWLEGGGMAGMFALAIGLNLMLFRLDPAFEVRQPSPIAIGAEIPEPKDPLLLELQRLMLDERIYADHDIRIGALAERLGTAEHKLRALINGKLRYRNFNQYVNGFRIDEAARRLVSQPTLPVISIALDVGFRSLSVFNQAFRDAEGCTPTEFRTRKRNSRQT